MTRESAGAVLEHPLGLLELRWLAASGRRSLPASVIVSARFARASREDARDFFGLLAQPRVRPHPEASGGFERSRDQDGTALLPARVAGREIPLSASLRVEGGRVHPPLTRKQLATLFAQLPAPSADLGNAV